MSLPTYAIIFILMMVEGPITTVVVSFLSSQGVFNIGIIFLLAVLGDLVADIVLFYLGRSSKHKYFDKIKKKKHVGKRQIAKIKNHLKIRPFVTIFVIKATGALAMAGLMIVGSSKMKTTNFILYSLIASAINKTVYASIGFFSGLGFITFLRNNEFAQFTLPLAILFLIVIIAAIIRVRRHITKIVDKSREYK